MHRWRDIPVSYADTLGPRSRPGVVRTGLFRDRLVVRGLNPLGAVIDWIRGFCSPLPQEEVGEGDYRTEGDLGTQVSPDDYSGGFAGLYAGDFPGSASAVSQPLYSDVGIPADQLGLTPTAPAKSSPAEEIAQARNALTEAKTRRDCRGVQQVLDTARLRRGTRSTVGFAAWQGLAIEAKTWLDKNKKLCR